jgi:ribosomal protein S8
MTITQIQRETIDMQCSTATDLFIYLDFSKHRVELYCSDEKSEEKRIKLNFIKIAKREGFIKSDKDFWKRIKDVTIKLNKEKTEYNLIYELD